MILDHPSRRFPPDSELQPISSIPDKKEGKPKVTSDNLSQRFPPISELKQEIYFSKPITEVSQLKTEEVHSIPSISDEKQEKLKVTSYNCKSCGNELIKKSSFCPYCGKFI